MSALTVRELSEKTIRTLKADYIASFGDKFSFTISRPEDPSVAKRRAAVLAIAGQWKDDRSDEDIIKDIENARTFGREVKL